MWLFSSTMHFWQSVNRSRWSDGASCAQKRNGGVAVNRTPSYNFYVICRLRSMGGDPRSCLLLVPHVARVRDCPPPKTVADDTNE